MTEKILCGKCNMMLYFGEEIKRRLGKKLYEDGIIGLETKGLNQIISERLPLYEKYADLYINTRN